MPDKPITLSAANGETKDTARLRGNAPSAEADGVRPHDFEGSDGGPLPQSQFDHEEAQRWRDIAQKLGLDYFLLKQECGSALVAYDKAAAESAHVEKRNVAEIERLRAKVETLEAGLGRVVKAHGRLVCRRPEHKPLRSPLCMDCQLDARIEEARAALKDPRVDPYTAPSPERPSTADEGLSISGQSESACQSQE
jgi:hypothetical protein